MTQLDSELGELARRIGRMSTRGKAALFWACSDALIDGCLAWLRHTHTNGEKLLRAAHVAAYAFAVGGETPIDAARLLTELEAATPSGEASDDVLSTLAQDCWICADVAVRVLVHQDYDPGPVIEYALEPLLGAVTEELFGVTQLASGTDENEKIKVVLRDQRVIRAFEFLTWATDYLGMEPDIEALNAVQERAKVIAP
jgi:hypothetical protein